MCEVVMNKNMLLTFFALWALPSLAFSQACCSAGVPLLGSLELPTTSVGTWQFSLTYERNVLRDVISGTDKFDLNNRRRTVHSVLLETNYGLAQRVSITALLSLIQQEREITNPFLPGRTDFLSTRGSGDAVVLLKYDLYPLTMATQRQIALGFGPKAPLGKSTIKTNGILLPADLQPGSGAWDGILWGYLYQGFLPTTTANLFGTLSYRYTGTNGRDYRFGNEFVATLGSSYRTNTIFDFSLSLRYRTVHPEKFTGNDVPNTGGKWLSVLPGVNLKFAKNWALRFSGNLPVYRNLQGTQLTTTYRASVSLFYMIPKSSFLIPMNK